MKRRSFLAALAAVIAAPKALAAAAVRQGQRVRWPLRNVPRPMLWLTPDSFSPATNTWFDMSGNENHAYVAVEDLQAGDWVYANRDGGVEQVLLFDKALDDEQRTAVRSLLGFQ